jgi:hypothetical protein
MVKFRNCVYVVVFFALISFLAFFPADRGKHISDATVSADEPATPSPIPQKTESGSRRTTPAETGYHYL